VYLFSEFLKKEQIKEKVQKIDKNNFGQKKVPCRTFIIQLYIYLYDSGLKE